MERDGVLIMVDDDRIPLEPGEEPMMKSVRFRTLGCYPLTGCGRERGGDPRGRDRRDADRPHQRQGRVIDHDGDGSMEEKKEAT